MTKSDTGFELVFVYGTLRRGGSNASRMDGAEFVGPATVEGRLYAITWYPGLVLESGSRKVVGELYWVGPEQMLALDEFEGISANEVEGAEYRRIKTVAGTVNSSGDGVFEEAWAYEWKGPVEEKQRIPSGDWLDAGHPRRFPYFTWIAAICLLCFPVGVLGAPIMGYYKDPRMEVVKMVMAIGGFTAPWAALGSACIARRTRENSEMLGCVFSFSVLACIPAVLAIIGGVVSLFG